jgi:hypothetical protein
MTNDEMNRRMEMFEKQQEAFASDMTELGFKLKDIAERQDRLQAQQEKQQSQIDLLLQALIGQTALIGDSSIRQKEAEQRMKVIEEKMAELAEAEARSEARLDALLDAQIKHEERFEQFSERFDRYLDSRNGKNGRSEN